MGHAFSEFIISTIREALPVISAVMGAFYGSARGNRTGARQFANIAAFAGLGWLGGFVLRSTILHLVEGGRPAFPTETPQQFPPPPIQPEPPVSTSAMSGLSQAVDPYTIPQQPAGSVDFGGGGAPPPKTSNDGVAYGPAQHQPPKKSKRNNTLATAAYGSVYGN